MLLRKDIHCVSSKQWYDNDIHSCRDRHYVCSQFPDTFYKKVGIATLSVEHGCLSRNRVNVLMSFFKGGGGGRSRGPKSLEGTNPKSSSQQVEAMPKRYVVWCSGSCSRSPYTSARRTPHRVDLSYMVSRILTCLMLTQTLHIKSRLNS